MSNGKAKEAVLPTGEAAANANRIKEKVMQKISPCLWFRNEAEEAVRSGCEHVMLSDRAVSDTRCPIPMILATGAVHSHLVRQQLRTFASVNVATGECLDVHHFAVLIGVGATTINAYVAEEAIAERHDRGLLPKLTLLEAVANYRKAVEDGLVEVGVIDVWGARVAVPGRQSSVLVSSSLCALSLICIH